MAEVNSLLTDFLPIFSINYWESSGISEFNCNSAFALFSLQFYQFVPHAFWCSGFGRVSALFEINIATSAFFWLVLVWYTTLHPFTFLVFSFFYLLEQSLSLAGVFRPFRFKMITAIVALMSAMFLTVFSLLHLVFASLWYFICFSQKAHEGSSLD